MEERKVQKLFGIELFEWEEWDIIDTGIWQFYNVTFSFPSMEKYNGLTISYNIEGEIEVYDEDGTVICKKFVSDIPEFLRMISSK